MYYARSDRVVLSGVSGDRAAAQEALERSKAVDEALCYIESAIFSTLCTLVENSQLYTF